MDILTQPVEAVPPWAVEVAQEVLLPLLPPGDFQPHVLLLDVVSLLPGLPEMT